MNRVLLGCIAVTLGISLVAAAQDVTPDAHSTQSPKTVTMSGRLSDDGRMLVTPDSTWTVSNLAAVRGKEGRQVTLKGRILSATHALDVLSVKLATGETHYAVNYGDSAFRR